MAKIIFIFVFVGASFFTGYLYGNWQSDRRYSDDIGRHIERSRVLEEQGRQLTENNRRLGETNKDLRDVIGRARDAISTAKESVDDLSKTSGSIIEKIRKVIVNVTKLKEILCE